VIPIVVHIVHQNGPENISDNQVKSQVWALNRDFANSTAGPAPAVNSGIQFCLASQLPAGSPVVWSTTPGITRAFSVQTFHTYGSPASEVALSAIVVATNFLLVRRLAQPNESLAFTLNLRRIGARAALAFSGQGGVDGLITAATPLGSFLFTTSSLELGLLFALFSLAAGIGAIVLGRVSDRVRVRPPFLLLGPILSVPACLIAYFVRDLGSFAFAVGWLSMTSAIAPSFIYTILIDRTEGEIPSVTAARELMLNVSRTLALLGGIALLALGGDVYALYLLVGGVILLEALAK